MTSAITQRKRLLASLAGILFISAGCSSTQHATWGDYSEELYTYYKAPTENERAELQQTMVEVFERAEQHGVRPPPGLYAEYATFLLQSGDSEKAVVYYDKERAAWPESTQFMSSLINTLNKHGADDNAEGLSGTDSNTDSDTEKPAADTTPDDITNIDSTPNSSSMPTDIDKGAQ